MQIYINPNLFEYNVDDWIVNFFNRQHECE